MDIKKQLDIPAADDFVDRSSYDTDKASLDTKLKGLEDGKVDKEELDNITRGLDNYFHEYEVQLSKKADKSQLNNLATKDELASIDVSDQLKDYAKQKDVENFQTELSSAVSENFNTMNENLNSKADKNHTHAMNEISGIQEEFKNVNTMMTSMNSVIDETITKIDKKADKSHTHSISDVSNLQATLDNKALKTHTHSQYLTSSTADTKYLKKGEPIELTSQQKEELKGEPGKDGMDGKQGPRGYTGANGQPGPKGDPGKGIVDVKSGREIKVWIGTQSEFDSIGTKDGDTLYLIRE